jgi:ABC-2 type transport system ATP-binding protein
MKVGEQAIYLARLKGLSRTDAIRKLKFWFEKFEIQAWWDKKVEELSKGMAQKVQFIVTILHEPSLLIFDEPFSGFDPINANLLKQEILALKGKGASVIFSTHNMGSVEEICDNIALINNSKKILDGRVVDVKQEYKTNVYEFTYKGDFAAVSDKLNGNVDVIEHREEELANYIKLKYAEGNTGNTLVKQVTDVAELVSFNEVIPSMDDIFIRVVNEAKNNN